MKSHAARFGIAAVAAVAASAVAYVPADICNVDVLVQYSTGGTGDLSFTISDQDTTGSIELQPGEFSVTVNGRLCSGDGSTVGYTGTSAPVTIDGSETSPVAIQVNALDTKTYGSNLDQSVDAFPIIVSVSVSPAIVSIGDTTTLSFAAIDPVDGVEPASYALTMDGTNGAFLPTSKQCGAGESCSIDYTAAPGDSGNIQFEMQVEDAAGQADTVQGYVAIDATGEASINVASWHIPEINTVVTSDHTVDFGATGTFSVPVTDVDLTTALPESLTLDVVISEIQSLTEGSQTSIGCNSADVSVASTTVDNVETFTVTWNPWNGESDAALYGEAWCKFTLQASDSAPGTPLVSQVVEFTMAAVGTPATGGGFAQLPVFEMIFVEDTAPTVGQQIDLVLHYQDPDSLSTLAIDDKGLSSSTFGPFTNEDCQSAPCSRTISIPCDGTPGTYNIELTLTDEDDSSLVDTRTIAITLNPAARKVRRGSKNPRPNTMGTRIQISDGKLTAHANRPIQPGNAAAPLDGGGGGDDDDGKSGVQPAHWIGVFVAVGTLVGVVVVVVTRRAARPDARHGAKLEANAYDSTAALASVTVPSTQNQQNSDFESFSTV